MLHVWKEEVFSKRINSGNKRFKKTSTKAHKNPLGTYYIVSYKCSSGELNTVQVHQVRNNQWSRLYSVLQDQQEKFIRVKT